MRACQEVPQRDEFAVVLVLDINHSPPVLAAADRLATHDDVLLRSDDGKRDKLLHLGIGGSFFLIMLLVIVRKHSEVMECKFLLDTFFEGMTFF